MKTKTLNYFVAALFATLFILASCSSDDSTTITPTAETTIAAKATFQNEKAFSTITIDTFLVHVEDFELEFDDDSSGSDDDGMENDDDDGFGDDDGTDDNGGYFDDIELGGPFELNLSEDGVVIPFANVDVPVGQYEELEFEITKSTNPESSMFQQSIRITGNIDGVPFIFWHDFEEELEVDFEDTETDISIENDGEDIIITFDLSFLFDSSGIDMSSATDDNGNGVIEISPNDTDGNNNLAEQIKDSIKESIDLLDD